MDFKPSQRRFGLLLLVGLAAIAMLLFSGGLSAVSSEPPASTGLAEPSVVVTGGYNCTVSEQLIYQDPPSDPLTFREITDGISMTSTGGILASSPTPRSPGGSQTIGPGGILASPPIATGLGTGHSFNDGTVEDCIRFAESMATVARSLNCVTSDVRHRPRSYQTESANLSFVCEGSVSAEVHAIGELSRAVLALKPPPAH